MIYTVFDLKKKANIELRRVQAYLQEMKVKKIGGHYVIDNEKEFNKLVDALKAMKEQKKQNQRNKSKAKKK